RAITCLYCVSLVCYPLLLTTHSSSCFLCAFSCAAPLRDLHSFPTRRSSDLPATLGQCRSTTASNPRGSSRSRLIARVSGYSPSSDRKSTRLNSSHVSISYAVFCLKKKNNNTYLVMTI